MYTLFDFVTHVKGIEYILALMFIAGYLIFWEALKPRPFGTVVQTGMEDIAHIKDTGGAGRVFKTAGKIAAAPFIGLAYVVLLPVAFFTALITSMVNLSVKGVSAALGKSISFEWRPMEAYLAGRKRKKEKAGAKGKEEK